MKPFTRISRILLPAMTVLLFVVSTAQGRGEPIKIGFVADFTSVSRPYTENAVKMVEFALARFNARGGLLGRPVKVILRDGANEPDLHYRHVTDLVRNENIVAVFGGASSPCVLKASAACKELKIPYLVSIGNAQSIVVENGHPYVFLFEPNSRMESMGFSIFASLMPWKRYAWFGPDYFWGRDVMGFFKQYFDAIGSPITWTAEIWHPLGTRDYKDAIEQVVASQPEALVVATWGEDLKQFLAQARQTNLFEKTAAFGWFSVVTSESDRILPEGIWKISRAPFNYLSEKNPETRSLIQKFFQQYKIYPFDFSICSYDSLLAWHTAVEKAGSAFPYDVAKTLKGLSFKSLRGDSFIRSVDGQMNCSAFYGRLTYHPDYPQAVIESVIEIPASKTWLSEKEIITRRAVYKDGKDNE